MTFTPVTLGSGLTGYNYLARTRETQQAIFDRDPTAARDVAQTTSKLSNVQTSDELMDDRTLLRVALGAFGLDEDINNRAFIKKILDSDLNDRQSLANRLADKRYLAFAETFNFNGESGPRLPDSRSSDELIEKLEKIESAQDLLSDGSLLRASLERFDLEDNIQNTYFLEQVLKSDLSDPESFANSFGNDSLVEFARTFDFYQKDLERAQSKTRVDDIVDVFSDALADIETANDLLSQPDLLEEAMQIFGLSDIYTTQFIEDVLTSDLNDDASVANSQSDGRFAAFAAAFNFATPSLDEFDAPVLDSEGEVVFQTGTLQQFLDAYSNNTSALETPNDFLVNRDLKEATFDLLGIENTFANRGLAERVLDSDPNDPNSFAELFPDPRFNSLSELFTFEPVSTERTYPEGFVDQVVRNYLDRQFEIQVGEVDPDMRVALSLERELTQLVRTSGSNDAQWFSVMSSPPLRQVFEGAFRLPESFGSIDIDQQLKVLKDRSEQFFGTTDVKDYIEPETLDELRQNYLVSRSTQAIGTTSNASIASIILARF